MVGVDLVVGLDFQTKPTQPNLFNQEKRILKEEKRIFKQEKQMIEHRYIFLECNRPTII